MTTGKRHAGSGPFEIAVAQGELPAYLDLCAVGYAERFVEAFGFGQVVFEAPNKARQFALLEQFGPEVRLSNVRLEELLRVEIYRRGLHSDAFATAPWRVGMPAASDA